MSEELAPIGDGEFGIVRRGYEPAAVDSYVARLRRQLEELRERSSTDGAVRHALERVGEEVAGILQRAHETSDEIVATGQREADQYRAETERHTAAVVAAAEQRLQELDRDTDRIWAERERIVADARDLAGRLLELADLAAARFPSDSAGDGELALD